MVKWLSDGRQRISSEITEVPEFFKQKYLPSLDGLRAFSVIYIIAFHWYLGWEYDDARTIHLPGFVQSVFREGILGVHFFFVLSGFLITTLLLKEKVKFGRISLKNFYIRRVFRIMPIATLYVLVTVLLNAIFHLKMTAGNYIYPVLFSENFNPSHNWYTTHYWSLAVEEQFYLVFPFIFTCKMPVYLRTALVLLAISPVVYFVFNNYRFDDHTLAILILNINIYLNNGLLSILAGTFLSVLMFKFDLKVKMNSYMASFFQLAVLLLVLLFHKRDLPGNINSLISDLFIAVFLFSIMMYKGSFFYRLFNTAVFKWIGILSYSIYIWQELFTAFQPWKSSFRMGSTMLFNLPLLVIVSFLSYNYFEKPFLKLKEKFK